MNNKELYESDEVVGKYATNSTRLRSLNNAEKLLIDRFDIKNKHVLVIGCGVGRVPANLLLYGNKVIGVDRSLRMIEEARKSFPNSKFTDLTFECHDAVDLSKIPDENFDVVLFPMNAIDYINPHKQRLKAIKEAARKVRRGGILALSSHNKLGYIFSPKINSKDRTLKNFFHNFYFDQEHVIGGGYIYKGNPAQVIREVIDTTSFSFMGFTCDSRNKIDRLFARDLRVAQFLFPYILYVFRKSDDVD